jgi:hypothetical protein
MQACNAIHLENLRQALKILAEGLSENSKLWSARYEGLQVGLETNSSEPDVLPQDSHQDQTAISADVVEQNLFKPSVIEEADNVTSQVLSNTSLEYFRCLTWHQSQSENAFAESDTDKQPTNSHVISSSEAVSNLSKTNGSYFANLPWQISSEAIVAAKNELSTASTLQLQPLSTSQAFFEKLDWHKVDHKAQQPDASELPSISIEDVTKSAPITGKVYFEGLAWHGGFGNDNKTEQARFAGLPLDAKTMGQLATQSALKTAARSIHENDNTGQLTSAIYFKTVFANGNKGGTPLTSSINSLKMASTETGSDFKTDASANLMHQVLTHSNKAYFQNLPWN